MRHLSLTSTLFGVDPSFANTSGFGGSQTKKPAAESAVGFKLKTERMRFELTVGV